MLPRASPTVYQHRQCRSKVASINPYKRNYKDLNMPHEGYTPIEISTIIVQSHQFN